MDENNLVLKRKYAVKAYDEDRKDVSERITLDSDYAPIFNPKEYHPEGEVSNNDINYNFDDMLMDIFILNNEIMYTAQNMNQLLQYTKTQLNNISEIFEQEKERLEDITMLCNKYTGFSNAIRINNNNVEGTLEYKNDAFMLPQLNFDEIKYSVTDIIGNGYEGNDFVYDKDKLKFIKDTSNTADNKYINDSSELTYYEYSRLSSKNASDNDVESKVNIDSQMAKCTISIAAEKPVNYLELKSDNDDIVVNKVSISNDNIVYKDLNIKDIAVNDKSQRMINGDYSYGSGIIEFKDSQYVKITLSAGKNSDDCIAVETKEDDETIIKILDDAKRSVIRINRLIIGRKSYKNSGKITFKQLNVDNLKSISIFANVYVPDELDINQCIKYTATVNGDSYELVPINSNLNGKKVIRVSQNSNSAEHVQYINETIKNISLSVDIKSTRSYLSPCISDLKILVGGD